MQIVLERKAKTITCFQYPIPPAYSFTDYRSQGQTIPRVVVDIASPPPANSCYSIYTSLYRGAPDETIRLLWEFDDEIFLEAHELELVLEDERLDDLDKTTKVWWQRISFNSGT